MEEVERELNRQEKKLQGDAKKAEALKRKEVQRKKAGSSKNLEDKGKGPATKNKKVSQAAKNIQKDIKKKRDEHIRRLAILDQEAKEEIADLQRFIPRDDGLIESFPDDSEDAVRSLTPPVRLSQEDKDSIDLGDTYQFTRQIFKQLGDRLRRIPRKYVSPFVIKQKRPDIPLVKSLALWKRLSSDSSLHEKVLIDYTFLIEFDGQDIVKFFADAPSRATPVVDFMIHCLRHDDIVHKPDSIGFSVFLSTSFYHEISAVTGGSECPSFNTALNILEADLQLLDITKAKLIFMPVLDGGRYFVYCFNMIHKRVDILDSTDYLLTEDDPESRHKNIFERLPLVYEAFKKISKNKLPRFEKWSRPFVDLPKEGRPNDSLMFLWKYLEYYDGEKLNITIHPFKGDLHRCEMVHYMMFHPLNQADIPDSLDVFRVGGRRLDLGSQRA